MTQNYNLHGKYELGSYCASLSAYENNKTNRKYSIVAKNEEEGFGIKSGLLQQQ